MSRRPGSKLGGALALAMLLVLAGCGHRGQGGPSGARAEGTATVTKVVDGDTLHVRLAGDEEKVRLIGIDTPETHGRGGLRECFGSEATSRLRALLPLGTQVRLVRDVEPRDRYGRLLAYVYRAPDGLFVNMSLARVAFATILSDPPTVAHAQDLGAAVRDARGSGLGLWRHCGRPDTPAR